MWVSFFLFFFFGGGGDDTGPFILVLSQPMLILSLRNEITLEFKIFKDMKILYMYRNICLTLNSYFSYVLEKRFVINQTLLKKLSVTYSYIYKYGMKNIITFKSLTHKIQFDIAYDLVIID